MAAIGHRDEERAPRGALGLIGLALGLAGGALALYLVAGPPRLPAEAPSWGAVLTTLRGSYLPPEALAYVADDGGLGGLALDRRLAGAAPGRGRRRRPDATAPRGCARCEPSPTACRCPSSGGRRTRRSWRSSSPTWSGARRRRPSPPRAGRGAGRLGATGGRVPTGCAGRGSDSRGRGGRGVHRPSERHPVADQRGASTAMGRRSPESSRPTPGGGCPTAGTSPAPA